jgi:DNA-binding response OmpR family regulator
MTSMRGAPLRLLVVDDDHDTVQAVAEGLRALGHDVMLAHSGAAALELATAELDAIILDINLNDTSGFDVAGELRRRGHRTRLVAWTGDLRFDRSECLEAGFDAYAPKPCSLAKLDALARGAASGQFHTI